MDNATTSPELKLDLHNLRCIKVLGRGATGTVFLVRLKSDDDAPTHSPFALKVVDKSLLLHANRRAHSEISILSLLLQQDHSFLPTFLGSFETDDFLGWATPFCPGGDLNLLRYQQSDHVFSPSVIRFYLAEIICALEKLHAMGIVYRDLKPENILIQQSGHVTLTDFDLSRLLSPPTTKPTTIGTDHPPPPKKNSKKNQQLKSKVKSARVSPVSRRNHTDDERSYSFVGTEEYVAPEIIRGDGHGFAVDWWALGVLSYEMLYGTTPFKGKNRKETYQRILVTQPQFPGRASALTDLIRKLLEKDPRRRMGYERGAGEIKEHEFFKGVKWDMLTEVVRPPFIPSGNVGEQGSAIDIGEYFQRLKAPKKCNNWVTEF